jgi:acetate kinase
VQPTRKRKREEGAHGKYISYHKKAKKYQVQVYKDRKLHHVGSFPTQEEAVVARDAYLKGETVINPAVKKGAHGKHISYNKANNKYRVQVTKDGKQQYVGSFPTQEEAVVARDVYLRGETVINPVYKEGAHGKYISYNKTSKKYVVQVKKDGKRHQVGYFPTQEEAVVARDAFMRGETVIKPAPVYKEGAHGKYIYYHKTSKKYVVQVKKDGKRHHVGYFPTQEEAVVARDALMRGETVIKPSQRTSGVKRKRKQEDLSSS